MTSACDSARSCLETLNSLISQFNNLVDEDLNAHHGMHEVVVIEKLRVQQLDRAESNLVALYEQLPDEQQEEMDTLYEMLHEHLEELREEHAVCRIDRQD